MRALLLLSTFLFIFSAEARPLEVEMKGFHFTYQEPHGTGSAESFFRNMKTSSAVEVAVEKIDENLQVKVIGAENHVFDIKNAPAFVQDAKTMIIEDMNLYFRETLSFHLTSGEFLSSKDELMMQELQLNCHRVSSHPELIDQVISGCVKNMKLSARKFNSEEAKLLLAQVLQQGLRGSAINIKDLDFKSMDGSYKLSAEVKAQLSGTARSKGNLSYDTSTGILAIKISEFKFGILNVKKMVFDELKKQQGDGLKVAEPYVYLTLKKPAR